MKKHFIFSILFLSVFSIVAAQPERIGVGLTFAEKKRFGDGDTGNPGLNIKTWIPVNKINTLHIVPSVSAFNPHDINHQNSYITTTYLFHGDLDVNYTVFWDKSLKLIMLSGVNYTRISLRNEILTPNVLDIPVDSSTSGFGPTLGLALEMRMSPYWDFIVSGRYSFTGIRAGYTDSGKKRLEAPLATAVIQVQAAYYFRSRSRGYSYR